jgi:hypothetical protein
MPSLPLPADPALRQQLFQAAVRVINNLRRDQLQSLKVTWGLDPGEHRPDPEAADAWNLIEPFVDCEPHIQRLTEDDYSQLHVSPTFGSIVREVAALRDQLAALLNETSAPAGPADAAAGTPGPNGTREESAEQSNDAADQSHHGRETIESTPFTETIRRLKGCGVQEKIVRYLWEREGDGREAAIRAIARDIYRVSDARYESQKRMVRKQLDRTRDSLDAKQCPLRLVISANSVQLVPAASTK